MKIPTEHINSGSVQGTEEKNPKSKELLKVSQQFESLFVNMMVGAMRKTVQHQGMVPQSHAEKMYQSLLDAEYANSISESGEMGFQDLIYEQLLQNFGAR